MKKLFLIVVSALFVSATFAQGVAPALCPEPQKCDVSLTEYVPLKTVEIACPDANAVKWANKHLKEWYNKYAPVVVAVAGKTDSMGKEEYALDVDAKRTLIKANTLQGVRYALYTLRQLAIAARDTKTVEGWIVPISSIEDKPDMEWRGIHICWFHENQVWEIERMIRLAAYYKLNYAVVETWGTFQSKVAPWWGWDDGKMTYKEVKRLKAIADDLGVTLIPQFNVFGHATNARSACGKHATLDLKPKYQPYFEPLGGWNWCLSNPNTIELQKKLIKELYELFGCPGYFHIGCDEANVPTCPNCIKQSYSTLLVNHISEISDYVRGLGAKTLLWHDMLIKRGDPRWKGFTANGTDATITLLEKLPKDVIICDWCYKQPREAYPTMDYFKGLGFDVLACPWNRTKGTKTLIQNSHEIGLKGILGTIWQYYYGSTLTSVYYHVSTLSWNKNSSLKPFGRNYTNKTVQHHLRNVGWDMKIKDPRHAGVYYDEVVVEPAFDGN